MKYDINHINKAIVYTLAGLLEGIETDSAKDLQGMLGSFFFLAAGGGSNSEPKDGQEPEGYCYPYRADPSALAIMCEAIGSVTNYHPDCRWKLIQKIIERSEELMAGFRKARDAGDYKRNYGYIEDLDDGNDWGRQMLALKAVFFEIEAVAIA